MIKSQGLEIVWEKFVSEASDIVNIIAIYLPLILLCTPTGKYLEIHGTSSYQW